MPTIHLMVGFMGFGKTTIAKQLEVKIGAKRLTHDEIMVKLYGRNPDNFQAKYKEVDDFIRSRTVESIQNGQDVILDYGFWTHQKREEYYIWAKTLTNNVVFHVVNCDLDVAKKRILERTEKDFDALLIDENTFDLLSKQYEPWNHLDDYPVVLHNGAI